MYSRATISTCTGMMSKPLNEHAHLATNHALWLILSAGLVTSQLIKAKVQLVGECCSTLEAGRSLVLQDS